MLASSHFAQWVSENIQDGSYVVFGIALAEGSDRSSTPESRSGKVQILDEREQKLDKREAMIERRLGELKDREKRLSAREASLEAKLNRYLPFLGLDPAVFESDLIIGSLFVNQRLPVNVRINGYA